MDAAVVDFRPGDLLGFSARDLLGALINLGTWGIPFVGLSHVAVVARISNGCLGCLGRLVEWESTSLYEKPCLITGKINSGVQAHEIWPRINGYGGRVYYYRLRHSIDSIRLTAVLQSRIGEGYDAFGAWRARETPLGFFARMIYHRHHAEAYRCSQFCSDLVADVWRDCDIWNPDRSDDWSPNRLARTARAVGLIGDPIRLK